MKRQCERLDMNHKIDNIRKTTGNPKKQKKKKQKEANEIIK